MIRTIKPRPAVTARQHCVALLVARGLSDKQIAARLNCTLDNVSYLLNEISRRWDLDPTLNRRVQITRRVLLFGEPTLQESGVDGDAAYCHRAAVTTSLPSQPTSSHVVHEFAKNKRERIRATLSEFEGRAVADLRVWVPRRSDGVLVPSPKGITFDRALLPQLEDAVIALRAANVAANAG